MKRKPRRRHDSAGRSQHFIPPRIYMHLSISQKERSLLLTPSRTPHSLGLGTGTELPSGEWCDENWHIRPITEQTARIFRVLALAGWQRGGPQPRPPSKRDCSACYRRHTQPPKLTRTPTPHARRHQHPPPHLPLPRHAPQWRQPTYTSPPSTIHPGAVTISGAIAP